MLPVPKNILPNGNLPQPFFPYPLSMIVLANGRRRHCPLAFKCPICHHQSTHCTMQRKYYLTLAFGLVALLFNACLRDECNSSRTFVRLDPVYKTPVEFRTGILVQGPRALKKPGKIYAFGQYLFINERQEGIHVIDNADPANPRPIAFWAIEGNVDMSIRGQYLYADQYVDLLSIDISDFQNPRLVCRQQDAFQLHGFVPGRGYLVDYTPTTITEEVPCNDDRWNNGWFRREDVIFVADVNAATSGPQFAGKNNIPAATGIAGSYARFGLYDRYLYTVDQSMLRTWTLDKPDCPARIDSTYVGWNIETIFPWKDRLFIGSQTGVFIFNNTNPQKPVQEAAFSHATGCDPVVVDGNNAYVTIHDGTTCNGTFNQLDVLDIQNLPWVKEVKTYPMTKPKGLSIAGKYLYLCDDGLKIFDKTQPDALKQLSHVKNLKTYDVIALDDTHLLVVGDSGFLQFDVSDPEHPKQVSLIRVEL